MPVLNPKILDNSHKEVMIIPPQKDHKTGIFPPIYTICGIGHNSWLLCDCSHAKYIRLADLGLFETIITVLQTKELMEKI